MRQSPKQKANLARGSRIRTLVMLYTVGGNCPDLRSYQQQQIMDICDSALIEIRGESETAKRKRERAEIRRAL